MLPAFRAFLEGNRGLIGRIMYLHESSVGCSTLIVERFEELPDYDYFFKDSALSGQDIIIVDTDTFNQLEQVGDFFG